MADTELTLEDLTKLKVTELKKELKERDLSVSGSKSELLARLQEAFQLQSEDGEQDISLDDTLPEDSEESAKETTSDEPAIKKIALSTSDSDIPKEAETKVVVSELTDAEKLKKRADKFGVQSEDARKLLRAERFGVVTETKAGGGGGKISSTPLVAGDLEKLKKRAERFGSVVSTKLSKLEEDAKIEKRKERFGSALTTTTNTTASAKINVNSKILGSAEDIEKKRKRAERFALT